MAHHEIPELSSKGLRQFGLILASILILLFGVLLPWVWNWSSFPNQIWIGAGLVILVWALIAPSSMRGLYIGWMRVALVIGDAVNTLILALVFYFVMTPMGVVMRLTGKDPMHRKLDTSLTSYRVISKVRARNHVERPF